uniref:Uncharacterized protein n=1 Tax=Timema tahoe TaxID=61484 RepID=A0A7R9FI34_9NEOP|nr:unnamed protein product [Timema tahoe]
MPTYLGYGPMPNACNMFKATRLPSVAMIQGLWVGEVVLIERSLGAYVNYRACMLLPHHRRDVRPSVGPVRPVTALYTVVITTIGPAKPQRSTSNNNSAVTSLEHLDSERCHLLASNNPMPGSPKAATPPHKLCLETSFTSLQSPTTDAQCSVSPHSSTCSHLIVSGNRNLKTAYASSPFALHPVLSWEYAAILEEHHANNGIVLGRKEDVSFESAQENDEDVPQFTQSNSSLNNAIKRKELLQVEASRLHGSVRTVTCPSAELIVFLNTTRKGELDVKPKNIPDEILEEVIELQNDSNFRDSYESGVKMEELWCKKSRSYPNIRRAAS